MSSESLRTLDQPTENTNDGEMSKELTVKSSKESDTLNNNHSTGSRKKARINAQRDLDDPKSNNQHEKNPKHNSHNLSENHKSSGAHKRLSFYYSDDESNESLDLPTVAPLGPKEKSHANSSHDPGVDAKDGSCQVKVKTNFKVAEKVVESASSTSSCSCEDHSSVANHSDADADDLHGDLDYDEDSITDSPPQICNVELDEESPNPLLSKTNSKQSLTSKVRIESNHDSGVGVGESNTNQTRSYDEEKKSLEVTNHSRIKSVINFNHLDKHASESKISVDEDRTSDDKSQKSYDCLLKYFFKDACFFQIKSINHENVELSKSMGVWSTPVQNEVRLNSAFREHRNVILIFSVQQSGGFQGFARMISESKPTSRPVPWVLPERLSNKSLGGVFKLEWLCTKELPFHETHDLYNSFNGNKPVKVARDGQQVEPKIGKKLCRLFPQDSKRVLLECFATLKRQMSQRKKSTQRFGDFYPLAGRREYMDDRNRPSYLINGLVESSPSNQLIHNQMIHNPHRLLGQRRVLDQSTPEMYNRPNPYQRPIRPFNVARNEILRCPMPSGHNSFHHFQNYNPPFNRQYSDPHDGWNPNQEMIRYHPYQRSRR